MSKIARLDDKDFESGWKKVRTVRDALRRTTDPDEAISAYQNLCEAVDRLARTGASNGALIAGLAACIGTVLTHCPAPPVDQESFFDGVALFVRDHFDIAGEAAEMEESEAVKH